MESKQVFRTYDGVEVGCRELVWYCRKDGSSNKPNSHSHGYDFVPTENDIYYYFSTKKACQAHIDSMNEAKQPAITISMYNQAGEKIISSEVCEFETGVHDGGLKNDMHQPIFEFTNETGKPITIKEGQRIAWKDGMVMLFDAPRTEMPNPDIHSAQMFGTPPNGQIATENKSDTKPLRSRNARLMVGDTPTATAKTHPYLAELMDSINSSKPKYVQMIGRSKRIKESTGCPYIIDDLETPSNPPFSASAKALKEYDEWKEETNRLVLLSQFSHAYNIPINTVLEFIVNQKTK